MPVTNQQPLTIVVGTGRCGSTMLSHLLAMHPDALSMSEFWNTFVEYEEEGADLPGHDMTGEELWARMTTVVPFYDRMVTGKGGDAPLFPSKFTLEGGMPAFALFLWQSFFEPPDPLYDDLAPVVSAWPKRPMGDHCAALFTELATRRGRPFIIERSGGSIKELNFLLKHFPDARFVFLHRDGPDAALSMSRYPTHRLAAFKYLAEAVAGRVSAAELEMFPEEIKSARPADFEGLASPPFDRQRFMTYPIPLTFFGAIWSAMIRQGTSEIRQVRPDRLLTLRYERILGDTRAELTKLADFIGMPADSPGLSPDTRALAPGQQWLDVACQYIDTGRSGSATAQLHPIDLAGLRSVCAAGNRAFDIFESEHAASVAAHA